jgi:hypothetical protein
MKQLFCRRRYPWEKYPKENSMQALQSVAVIALSAGLLLEAGCAPSYRENVAGRGNCFYASEVNNFSSVNRDTVNFRVGVSDIYTAHMLGNCGDVAWTDTVAFESGPSSLVCDGVGATLIVPTLTGPRRCPISSIRKLTPQEVQVLPHGTTP